MKQILLNVLNSFGFPVFLLGTLGENEPYPPAFFTFSTLESDDICFDDEDSYAVYRFQIIFYANDPHIVEEVATESRRKLKAAGFIPDGRGEDIQSEEPTHTGWVCEYSYFKED